MKTYGFAVLMSLLALVACSNESSRQRGQFVAGCVQGGASKGACQCVFDKLSERYSTKELQALDDVSTLSEEFKRTFKQALLACRDK